MGATIAVEMGDTRVSRNLNDQLLAFGLGACVGLCLYDPIAHVAGMVHVVLPQTLPLSSTSIRQAQPMPAPGKCADTALPNAIAEIEAMGGNRNRLCAAIAGGAQIFTPPGSSLSVGSLGVSSAVSRLEIGQRNILAVRAALEQARIPLLAENVGGSCGRTVTFHVSTGEIWVREIGAAERCLVSLGGKSIPELKPTQAAQRGVLVGR